MMAQGVRSPGARRARRGEAAMAPGAAVRLEKMMECDIFLKTRDGQMLVFRVKRLILSDDFLGKCLVTITSSSLKYVTEYHYMS